MYRPEKSRKIHRNEPSFSSTLLDEIYRSIDANDDNTEDSMFFYRDYKLVKGQVNFMGDGNYGRIHRAGDEEMSGFTRACNPLARRGSLVADPSENKSFRHKEELYFSSNSTSSDTSGALSSSPDADFFSSSTKSRVSSLPKPVRVGGQNRQEELDDYKMGDDKSKSRALKIYASFKKMKQPISPGGKLTRFINSLFNHAKEKKVKDHLKSMGSSSNCSWEKMRNGIQTTSVSFDPVNVILNKEYCGSKSIIRGDCKGFGTNQLDRGRLRVKNRRVEEDDDEDAMSDLSCDLFELDHSSLFRHNRFCQDLPMYETTRYDVVVAASVGLLLMFQSGCCCCCCCYFTWAAASLAVSPRLLLLLCHMGCSCCCVTWAVAAAYSLGLLLLLHPGYCYCCFIRAAAAPSSGLLLLLHPIYCCSLSSSFFYHLGVD